MTTLSPRLTSRAHASEISEQYLKQIGRVVVASARLESSAGAVVAAMKVDRAAHPDLDAALHATEHQSGASMPPWVGVSAIELGKWVGGVRRLLGERTRLFTAVSSHRFSGSDGDAPRVVGMDGTVYPGDERYLERLLTRLARHEIAGRDISVRLEYVDQKGASWPLAAWHVAWSDPARTDPMDWYPEHLAQLPADWRSWLEGTAAPVLAARR